jgi:hypothetical protein
MRTPAQPKVNLYTQVSPDTDQLRRRLEARTGFSLTRLVTEALQLFEKHLSSLAPPKPSKPARR